MNPNHLLISSFGPLKLYLFCYKTGFMGLYTSENVLELYHQYLDSSVKDSSHLSDIIGSNSKPSKLPKCENR